MADKETRTPPNPAEGSEPAAPNAEINALLRAAFGTGQSKSPTYEVNPYTEYTEYSELRPPKHF